MNAAKLALSLGTLLSSGVVAGCGEDAPCDPSVPGTICAFAGTSENGYTGEGGPALDARLSLPMDMLAGPDGSLFVLDWNNHRIRKISPDGTIDFVAGNGELGGSLDDPATGALNHPTNLAWDPAGSLIHIAAWHNSKVMTLDPATGVIAESCGDGRRAYFGDGLPAATAALDLPTALAFSPQGALTILDQANQVIRQVDSSGNIQLLAGRCIVDGPDPIGPGACVGGAAPVACPAPSGKWTCGNPMTTCGMPCWTGYSGDDIPATEMRMAQGFGQDTDPGGHLIYDPQGNLYFADKSNNLIRMIDTQGIVRRIAGQPPIDGERQVGFTGDGGPAKDALLNHPVDLALGDDGTLYFSDVLNNCIRAIAPDQTISTVAGVCGQRGYDGDGGPAVEALLTRPYGIEVVGKTLYIADTGNSVIRKMTLP